MKWFIEGMKKYATFAGRANRKEYWNFFLIYFLFSIIASVADVAIGKFDASLGFGPISGTFYVATLLPSTAIAVRRLHDTNRTGWWMLLLIVPLVGLIWVVILLARAGDVGPNPYGQAPAQGA